MPARYAALFDEAYGILRETMAPVAIWQAIAVGAFAEVYQGEGRNATDTPLEHIFPRADVLHLFAVTLGAAVSERIDRLFEANDPAVGYVLDLAASEAADLAVHWLGRRLMQARRETRLEAVLSYSPGYCGWHITGQRALFATLNPEQIGISLNSSCLMSPMKSVSGVLVGGSRAIHKFHNTYPFCEQCSSKTCRERVAALDKGGG